MRIGLCFFAFLFFAGPVQAFDTYADIVDEIMPSVVNISTEKKIVDNAKAVDNFMISQDLEGRESLGSGFFIRDDGYILTNYHVIRDAKMINVITNDGKSYEAKVIGQDIPSDLVVLKIEDKNTTFKPVMFGDADKARIGDIVLTFGNPYGLGISVSQGIVSAKSRSIGLGEQQYIQTDAAINQGNSGGPMFNLDGEVIGINSAIFSQGGASGVGFALPSNIANWISGQLVDSGKVRRGWIGMETAYGIDKYTDKQGFVITEISENSAAYKEGLRVGDIIIAYNDKAAVDLNVFKRFVETLDAGQALRLKILSSGQEMRVVIRVQDMPAETLKNVTNKALTENRQNLLKSADGNVFYVSEMNMAVREATPRGLMIVKLERRSPLYDKGVSTGDIILEADGSDIYSTDNLLEIIHNSIADDYRPISLLIQGINEAYYVSVGVDKEND